MPPVDRLSKSLISGTVGSLAVKLVSLVLLLLVNIALARILGPEGFGHYALAIAVTLVTSHVCTLGTPQLVVRELPVLTAQRRWATMNGLLRTTVGSVLLFSLIVGIMLSSVTFLSQDGTLGQGAQSLILAGMLIPALSTIILCGSILRGFGHILLGQIPQLILLPALLLVSTLVFFFL